MKTLDTRIKKAYVIDNWSSLVRVNSTPTSYIASDNYVLNECMPYDISLFKAKRVRHAIGGRTRNNQFNKLIVPFFDKRMTSELILGGVRSIDSLAGGRKHPIWIGVLYENFILTEQNIEKLEYILLREVVPDVRNDDTLGDNAVLVARRLIDLFIHTLHNTLRTHKEMMTWKTD